MHMIINGLIGSLHEVLYHDQYTNCLIQDNMSISTGDFTQGYACQGCYPMGVNVSLLIWRISPHNCQVAPPVMQQLAVHMEVTLIKITQQSQTQGSMKSLRPQWQSKTSVQTKLLNDSNWLQFTGCQNTWNQSVQYNYRHGKTSYGYSIQYDSAKSAYQNNPVCENQNKTIQQVENM